VQMSEGEWSVYLAAIRRANPHVLRRLEEGLLTDEELRQVLNSLAMARQVLMSPDAIVANREPGKVSSKVKQLVADVLLEERRALVFTNFVEYGAHLIHRELTRSGARFALYTGKLATPERTRILAKLRAGDLQGLVMSPVGSEGLDIPEAESVYVADPHFNPEVTKQMVGRTLRIGSRIDSVRVRQYVAVSPEGKPTVDGFVLRVAERKANLNEKVRALLLKAEALPTRKPPIGDPHGKE
jgi:superfamily II DNA or RNA helicase